MSESAHYPRENVSYRLKTHQPLNALLFIAPLLIAFHVGSLVIEAPPDRTTLTRRYTHEAKLCDCPRARNWAPMSKRIMSGRSGSGRYVPAPT